MDELDIRIMREMVSDPVTLTFQSKVRNSYRLIARKLGVSEDTVLNRIRALEKGYLKGWRIGLNPSLLGYRTAMIDFDPSPRAKGEVLHEMRAIPGMMWIKDYFGDYVGGLVAYRDEDSLKAKMSPVLGGAGRDTVARVDVRFPICEMRLLETDWGIIEALQKEPRRKYEEVAKGLHVSSRTVRRRLEKLMSERAIFIMPEVNLKALKGTVKVNLVVRYQDSRTKREIDRKVIQKLGPYLTLAFVFDPLLSSFTLNLPNLSIAEELRSEVSGISGVRDAWMKPLLAFYNLVGEVFQTEVERRSIVGAEEQWLSHGRSR